MTKEDYMFLPKERLAELLAERDTQHRIDYAPIERFTLPCYAPGGICTNPQKDCINCPKQFGDVTTITTTNTFENLIEGSKGMIKEDYCSDELCELLRAKGMNKSNFTHYVQKNNKDGTSEAVTVCTLQMAMKWLREKHQLHISVDVSPIYGKVKDGKGRNTCDLLYWHYMASGEWMNDKYNPQQKAFVVSEKSHKEAIEAALKYTLEKLI